MTDYNQLQQDFQNQPQISLPNSTAVLILGIIGIVGCCCYGGGAILSIVALVLAAKDMTRYRTNPSMYTKSSYNNLNAGRICAIIGLVISVLYLAIIVMFVGIIGWENMQNPEAIQEALQNM